MQTLPLPSHLSPAVKKKFIALKVSRKQVVRFVYFYEENKSIKFQTVKSKIATFLVIKLFLTQFITRPNLASSVAKNVRRFFSVLIFPETTSNYYLYQNPFKREDIMKGKLGTVRHMKNCINFLRRHEICKFWDVYLSHYPSPERVFW